MKTAGLDTLGAGEGFPLWQRLAVFGAAYSLLAEAGFYLSPPAGGYVTFWLPAGIFLAMLLRTETREWPWVAAAAIGANILFDGSHGQTPVTILMFNAANTSQSLTGAWLVRRFVAARPRLATMKEYAGLVLFGAALSTMLGAVIGAATLVTRGFSASFAHSWQNWWVSEAMAVLLLTTVILAWTAQSPRRFFDTAGKVAEFCALSAGMSALAWYLFVRQSGIGSLYAFFLQLFIIWAAVRFGTRGASAVSFWLALMVAFLTIRYGRGLTPAQIASGEYVPMMQLFLAVTSLVGLVPAIAIRERDWQTKKLSEGEERFRHLAEAGFEGVILAQDGLVTDANDQALRMHGRAREEMSGRPFEEFVAPESRDAVRAAIESGTESSCEFLFRRKDGSVFEAELRCRVTGGGGDAVRMTAIRDISERKRIERREARRREILEQLAGGAEMRTLLESVVAMVEQEAPGTICSVLLADDTGRRLHTGAAPNLPGFYTQTIEGLEAGPEAGSCGTALFTGKRMIVEDITTHPYWKDYRELAARAGLRSCWAEPIIGGTGKVLGSFAIYHRTPCVPAQEELELIATAASLVRIALERRQAEKALSESEERLRHSQKMDAVGQLSGGVAHDFNNILSIIRGGATLLQMNERFPAELGELLEEIIVASDRASNLTRQLLAFSRRHPLSMRNLDLNGVVRNMHKMLERILGEDVSMELDFPPAPALVQADAGMIEQVLLNLVVNAREAMPKGGRIFISVEFEEIAGQASPGHSHLRVGAYVKLTVRDTGGGISPEVMPRIFEPFFTTKDVGKGTGLGLAMVYGIVEQHRGWVSASSAPAQGTVLEVFLPRLETAVAEEPAKPPANLPRGGETILLVEDEASLRQIIHKLLTRLGYRILEAASGPEALQVWEARSTEIQLLLTDMVMPDGINGRELAQRLQEKNPALKVMYMSGYSAEVAGEDMTLIEGVNFLSKPFDHRTLASTVRKVLES